VYALSFLTELDSSILDTNVLRTTLVLLASLRKLPQTSPVLSATEAALAFLMRRATGTLEQRQVLIDGGMLNSVFDMLAHMGHGHPGAYLVACGALYHLADLQDILATPNSETAPIIRRLVAAAFAYGPVNDQGVPVPLWNFANGVAGYPAEITALLAAKKSRHSEGSGASWFNGSAEEQAHYAHTVKLTMMLVMEFGLTDGSNFNNSGGRGKAYANSQSWWHGLHRRMRALLKNSSDSSAVDLLQFCASAVAVAADTNRGSKGRFR
jgi:hypothetical protein